MSEKIATECVTNQNWILMTVVIFLCVVVLSLLIKTESAHIINELKQPCTEQTK